MTDNQKKLDTSGLVEILKESSELKGVLDDFSGNINNPTLHTYLSDQIRKRGLQPSDVIQKTSLSKSFVYQVLAGTRVPSRDVLLQLSFLIGMDLEGTQKLLTIAQRGILYPKVRRDAAILFCLNKKFTLEQANDLLSEVGELSLV